MNSDPSQFQEPDHPEVTSAEFEAASETSKEELFKLVETKAKTGFEQDIGAAEPAHAAQLDLPGGEGTLELWWNPDYPADEDFPLEKGGGTLTKIDYLKNKSGDITGTITTTYDLMYVPDGLEVHKTVDEGFTPDQDDAMNRLLVEAQASDPLTPEEVLEMGKRIARQMDSMQSTDDFIADAQTELEMGMNLVSESEVRELINLIPKSTPKRGNPDTD